MSENNINNNNIVKNNDGFYSLGSSLNLYTAESSDEISSQVLRKDATGVSSQQTNLNLKQESTPNRKKKGQHSSSIPYMPSYMDLSNGPEPCVVCGDAATGYHYRCMTCEGCKGFFRRTIQKNLQYQCKWGENCIIEKNTRNQCQQCRFKKCIAVGMATDLVLNEKQRIAKRKLIEENRERRKRDLSSNDIVHKSVIGSNEPQPGAPNENESLLSDEDQGVISTIVQAFESSTIQETQEATLMPTKQDLITAASEIERHLKEMIAPSVMKIIDFAKSVPGFESLDVDDRALLLKSCCMEIMCLKVACQYNNSEQSITLTNGCKLYKNKLELLENCGTSTPIIPIFEFAQSMFKLKLDRAEVALLAAILLMQSDRVGLKNPKQIEAVQEVILGVFNRYICRHHSHSLRRWATILMKVTDLRAISTSHADRILPVKSNELAEMPKFFFETFDHRENPIKLMPPPKPQMDTSPVLPTFLNPPSIPCLFSPTNLQRVPSLSDFHSLTSPMLCSPSLLITSPLWFNKSPPLPNLPPTPRTPIGLNIPETKQTLAALISNETDT